jgi:hypothetical protein
MAKAVSSFFASNDKLDVRSGFSYLDLPDEAYAYKASKKPGPFDKPKSSTVTYPFMGNAPKTLLGDGIRPAPLWRMFTKFNGVYNPSGDPAASKVMLDPCTGMYGPSSLAQAGFLRVKPTKDRNIRKRNAKKSEIEEKRAPQQHPLRPTHPLNESNKLVGESKIEEKRAPQQHPLRPAHPYRSNIFGELVARDYEHALEEYIRFYQGICQSFPDCDLGRIVELADHTIPFECATIHGTCVRCNVQDVLGIDKRIAYAESCTMPQIKEKKVLCFSNCFRDRVAYYKPLICADCGNWTHFGWCKYIPKYVPRGEKKKERLACFGCCFASKKPPVQTFDARASDFTEVGLSKAVSCFDSQGFVVIEGLLPDVLCKSLAKSIDPRQVSGKDGFMGVDDAIFNVKQFNLASEPSQFFKAANEALTHGFLDKSSLDFITALAPIIKSLLRGDFLTGVVGKSYLTKSGKTKSGKVKELVSYVKPHWDRSQFGPSVFPLQNQLANSSCNISDPRELNAYPSVQVVGVVDGGEDSGCFMVLPRSHLFFEERITRTKYFDTKKHHHNQTEFHDNHNRGIFANMVAVPMKPGAVCFFDSKTIHGNAKGLQGGRKAYHAHFYPASGTPFGLPVLYGLKPDELTELAKHYSVDLVAAKRLGLNRMLTGASNPSLPTTPPDSFDLIPDLPHRKAPKQYLDLVKALQEKHPFQLNQQVKDAEEAFALSKRNDRLPTNSLLFESADPLFYIKCGNFHYTRKHMERLGGGQL